MKTFKEKELIEHNCKVLVQGFELGVAMEQTRILNSLFKNYRFSKRTMRKLITTILLEGKNN